MESSAVGCKLLTHTARTSSSFKKFILSHFFYVAMLYKILFSNLGLMSLQPFVPSALISSVISSSNMVSVCVPVVHERHKSTEFDWQNDYEERVSLQWWFSLYIIYKWQCHNCFTLIEQSKKPLLYPWRNVKWKIFCVLSSQILKWLSSSHCVWCCNCSVLQV